MATIQITVRPRLWVATLMWLLRHAKWACFWVPWVGADRIMAAVKRHGFVVSA